MAVKVTHSIRDQAKWMQQNFKLLKDLSDDDMERAFKAASDYMGYLHARKLICRSKFNGDGTLKVQDE